MGQIDEAKPEDIANFFYDLPEANKRRNRHIYPSGKTGDLKIVNLPELLEKSGFSHSKGSFVYPGQSSSLFLFSFT